MNLTETQLEKQLKIMAAPYVVMGIGAQGSGKTTILSKIAEHLNIARVCPDEIREELTGDQSDQTVNNEAWTIAYERIGKMLSLGDSVIVDATHSEAWRRPQTIKQYRSNGAVSVVAVVFDVSLELAVARNSKRIRVVPNTVIERTWKELKSQPASTKEGFDYIFSFTA